MTGYLRFIPLLLLLALPAAVFAADVPMQQVPQSVEEPDAPDEDSGMDADQPRQTPAENPKENTKPVPVPQADATPPGVQGEAGDASYDEVMLRALNKVTAHSQSIEATIGSSVRFGTIEIVAHRCWKSAPEERPENAALLEISEVKQGEAPSQIFLGWMFSSTPGLSALEHPFYDITVVECKKAAAEKQPETPAPAPAPKKAKSKVQ